MTVLVLGLLSLLFGVFAGVPALLVGKRVVAEIGNGQQGLTGGGNAKAGVVFAWFGIFLWTFIIVSGIALISVTTTCVIFFLAVVTGALWWVSRRADGSPAMQGLGDFFSRVPVLAPALVVTFALSGTRGVVAHWNAARAAEAATAAAARRCPDSRAELAAAIARDDYAAARSALEVARTSCDARATSELDAAGKELDTKEAAYKQRVAAEEDARAKRALEEKERKAVQIFPERSKAIASTIHEASTGAASGKWAYAANELSLARKALAEFEGTSVQKSKAWAELDTQVAQTQKRIQPQLDRIERERDQAAAKDKLNDASRGPKPMGGSTATPIAVKMYLEEVAKDPDSLKMDRCTDFRADGPSWVVECRYRAKNSFGGMNVEAQRFFIQAGGPADQGRVVRTEPL
jgi:hypothetical protein